MIFFSMYVLSSILSTKLVGYVRINVVLSSMNVLYEWLYRHLFVHGILVLVYLEL